MLAIDPGMLPVIAKHVTVDSGSNGLDAAAVTPELAELVTKGKSGLSLGLDKLPAEFAMASGQKTFVVLSEAHSHAGAAFVREAIVEMAASRTGVYKFKAWRRGLQTLPLSGEDSADERPPC